MFGLRRNTRGTIGWSTPIGIVLLTAIIGGLGAAVSVLLGYPTLGGVAAMSAVFAGITEFITMYKTPGVGTLPLKTVLVFVLGAAVVGIEYLLGLGVSAYTYPTILAAVAVAIAYFQQELGAGLKGAGTIFKRKP